MMMMMQLSALLLLILFSLTSALIVPQQQNHHSTGIESRGGGVSKERQRQRVGSGTIVYSSMAEFESSYDQESTSKWQDIIFDDYVASDWLNMDEDSSCDLFPEDYNTQLLGRAVLSSSSVIPTVDVTNVMEYLNIRRV
mmetsp:Transcript_42711/g.46366  ORF Transcript_42711/g.46366 Transcript_42711/m.46366 type:complete len:139 (-) Transcript_42711:265-681(-)